MFSAVSYNILSGIPLINDAVSVYFVHENWFPNTKSNIRNSHKYYSKMHPEVFKFSSATIRGFVP